VCGVASVGSLVAHLLHACSCRVLCAHSCAWVQSCISVAVYMQLRSSLCDPVPRTLCKCLQGAVCTSMHTCCRSVTLFSRSHTCAPNILSPLSCECPALCAHACRVLCDGQPCLPVGTSDLPNTSTVKIFCPKCEDVYYPRIDYQVRCAGHGVLVMVCWCMKHGDF
jgi:hypothetical protein